MAKNEDIRTALKELTREPKQTILGKVVAVDNSARTCDVDDDGVTYYDVPLQSIPGASGGVVIIPEIGSQVLMARVEHTDTYCVIQTSKTSGVIIADGNNGGVVNIDPLFTWMQLVYTDIRALAMAVNSLGATVITQTTQPQKSKLEDVNLKH